MTESLLIDQLAASRDTIVTMVRSLTAEQWVWSPDPARWSALEVVCHLLDEEREDFRVHLRATLDDPTRAWAPIDPETWVTTRGYREQSPDRVLAAFSAERDDSLAWLRSLDRPDWTRAHQHRTGPLTAGDLLASWADHDLLHLRQLLELRRQYLTHHTGYSPAYANA